MLNFSAFIYWLPIRFRVVSLEFTSASDIMFILQSYFLPLVHFH